LSKHEVYTEIAAKARNIAIPNHVRWIMMLTTKGRYAVMAMTDIAMQCASQAENTPINLSDIAQRQAITVNYLEQLFNNLRRHALVHSVRGPGGGYVLAKSPELITVADIIHAAEESIKMTRCDNEITAGCRPNHSRCSTHYLWEDLGNHILTYLQGITLADICQGKFSTAPLAVPLSASL
jgi:Rrf2 family iron-sulfur cluster assembly transcriptional regulator